VTKGPPLKAFFGRREGRDIVICLKETDNEAGSSGRADVASPQMRFPFPAR
jgi:hypothetical protein